MIGDVRESGVVDDDLSDIPAEELDPDAPVRGRPHDPQWDVTLAVIVGGILGAEARYGLSVAVPHAPDGFPWSTLWTNVIGCFCLGLLMSLLNQLTSPHRLVRPFVGIGILGGFTTFSTFTVDAERLIQHHRAGLAGLYVVCTLLAAAAAVAAATISAQLAGRYVYQRRLRRADAARSQHRAPETELSRGRP
jgi:CrcB protein